MLTVVELDVVPVDEVPDRSVDGQVSTTGEFSGREPGRDGGVGQDVVTCVETITQKAESSMSLPTLWENSPELSGESLEPRFSRACV